MVTLKTMPWGAWVAQSVKYLPLAQVMISGSWDRALSRLPTEQGASHGALSQDPEIMT